jgi:hypothetical protein
MSDIAIRVENLSKLYEIGAKQERYKTLRDTIVNAFGATFRCFKNPQSLARAVRSKLHWAEIRNKYAAA